MTMNASMLLKITSDHIRGINQKERGPLVTYVLSKSKLWGVHVEREKKNESYQSFVLFPECPNDKL
jgi:hypothetical protein